MAAGADAVAGWSHQNRDGVAVGSGRRLLEKLQDRELGITRQEQQLLEDDGLCPGGSGGCRG